MENKMPTGSHQDKLFMVIQRAKAAVLSRDYLLAIRIFKRVLVEQPDNIDILLQLAHVYIKAEKDDQALKLYLGIKDKVFNNFEVLMNLGGIYRRLGQFDKSIAVLKKALLMGNNIEEVKYSMGFTYKLMKEYAMAEDCFVDVIDIHPNDVLAYNHLGNIESLQGKYEKAQKAFLRGLQIDPNHPILHLNASLNFLAQENYEQAKKHCEVALRAKPGWPDAMAVFAEVLEKTNDNDEAKKILTKAVTLNPDNPKVHTTLANFYESNRDYKNAEDAYLEAVKLDPENTAVKFDLANTYALQKKYGDAVSIFEEVEKVESLSQEGLMEFSKALIELNRMDEAFAKIKKLENKNSDDLQALNMFSQFFIRNGDMEEAKKALQKIQKIYPKENKYLYDNAKQYTEVKKYSESKRLLEKYLLENGKDWSAWHLLSKNLEELRQYADALNALKNSIEISRFSSLLDEIVAMLQYFEKDSKEAQIIAALQNKFGEKEKLPEDSRQTSSSSPFDQLQDPDEKKEDDTSDIEPLFNLDANTFGDEPRDEYDPLILTEPENFDDDESEDPCDLSNLVQNDEPVDYQPGDDLSTIFDDMGHGASQENPIEDQEYMNVDGTSFTDEDWDSLPTDDEDEKEEIPLNNDFANFEEDPDVPLEDSPEIPCEQPKIEPIEESFEDLYEEEERVEDAKKPLEKPAEKEDLAIESPIDEEPKPEENLDFLDDEDLIDVIEEIEDVPLVEPPLEEDPELADIAGENTAPDVLPENIDDLYEDPMNSLDMDELSNLLNSLEDTLHNDEAENDSTLFDENFDYEEFEPEQQTLPLLQGVIDPLVKRVRNVMNKKNYVPSPNDFKSSAEMFHLLHSLYDYYLSEEKKNTLLEDLKDEDLSYVAKRLANGPGLLAAADAVLVSDE